MSFPPTHATLLVLALALAGCKSDSAAPAQAASAAPDASPSAASMAKTDDAPSDADPDPDPAPAQACTDAERVDPASADDLAWVAVIESELTRDASVERLQCLMGSNPRKNASAVEVDPHTAAFASVRVAVIPHPIPNRPEIIERYVEVVFPEAARPEVATLEKATGPTQASTRSPHGPPTRHIFRATGIRLLLDLDDGNKPARITSLRIDNQGPSERDR